MLKEKIAQRFDTVDVPRGMTISDLALAMNINLVSGWDIFIHRLLFILHLK